MSQAMADADIELRFSYTNHSATTPASANQLQVAVREFDTNNRIYLVLREDGMWLSQKDGGVFRNLAGGTVNGSAANTLYHVRVVADGANIKVYRAQDGQPETEIFNVSTATMLTQSKVQFSVAPNGQFSVDDIYMDNEDGLITSEAFTYNAANELTQVARSLGRWGSFVAAGTTTYTYDPWGQTASKSQGTHSADYTFGYGGFLTQVASTFPGEGTVDYKYGGNGKRRERNVSGGDYTWYNWAGWSVINEEDNAGTLTKTLYGGLGEITGPNPAAGTDTYLFQDHLGSTVGAFDASKASLGTASYTPFGSVYSSSLTSDITRGYTGHDYDNIVGLDFAPFRYMQPGTGRWLKRDPLGMIDGPNMYGYVGANPVMYVDPFGLHGWDNPLRPRGFGRAKPNWIPRMPSGNANAAARASASAARNAAVTGVGVAALTGIGIGLVLVCGVGLKDAYDNHNRNLEALNRLQDIGPRIGNNPEVLDRYQSVLNDVQNDTASNLGEAFVRTMKSLFKYFNPYRN
jgi:RHS repeat-associated protein